MSEGHGHTHAPGEPTHSHGPGQPSHTHGPQQLTPQQIQMLQQQQQQQQMANMRPPDPVMQALIEEVLQPVDIVLGDPENSLAFCGPHKLEKCADCGLDFAQLNLLSRVFLANAGRIPPPPQQVTQQITVAVTKMKEEGNKEYKAGHHDKAVEHYTAAARIAVQRPPWEAQQLLREELSTVLSNRSAAYLEGGDYLSAFVDADLVSQLKRGWGKGHFRRAKALLKLGQYTEAKESLELGLAFEPNSQEMHQMIAEINSHIRPSAKALEAGAAPIPVSA